MAQTKVSALPLKLISSGFGSTDTLVCVVTLPFYQSLIVLFIIPQPSYFLPFMQTLLVGSNNAHKVQEMKEILETRGLVQILVPNDVVNFPDEIAETGSTLEENAYIKAMAIYENTLQTCLADDTGLEVDALQGAPGVFTARYAGEHATYADNRAKLLAALKDIPENKRTARFRTVICYRDDLRTLFAEGVCEGSIATEERGDAGFGYDSIFIPHGYSQTFAELSAEEKHRISHRGLALRHFEEILRGLE